ncbi:MAG: Flp family type IVb pilin [Nevskiaceae bacterium]|nr:MAG: Flp family type IVb pilin [Nevskiaceae bacterium]TBR73527.1 MAG: Flp family type IVb pilin [Nevskiaceae bacterium]
MNEITKFLRDEEGATAIEYGLIVGLIAVAIVVILGTIGSDLKKLFGMVSSKLPTTAPTT